MYFFPLVRVPHCGGAGCERRGVRAVMIQVRAPTQHAVAGRVPGERDAQPAQRLLGGGRIPRLSSMSLVDQPEPLSDNERAVVDHRGRAEKPGDTLAAEEILVGPAPVGGIGVTAAFGPRVVVVDLADRDYATSVSSMTTAGARRVEHR